LDVLVTSHRFYAVSVPLFFFLRFLVFPITPDFFLFFRLFFLFPYPLLLLGPPFFRFLFAHGFSSYALQNAGVKSVLITVSIVKAS